MSNTSSTNTTTLSTGIGVEVIQNKDFHGSSLGSSSSGQPQQQLPPAKKKRNLLGNPDPGAELIALSPTTLMATNRFVCEIYSKGFQMDQNLQLHRRGYNLPWKLRQRAAMELIRKRVYVCSDYYRCRSSLHKNRHRSPLLQLQAFITVLSVPK